MPAIPIVIPIFNTSSGIVRKPTVWVFITLKYPGTHDIGPPSYRIAGRKGSHGSQGARVGISS